MKHKTNAVVKILGRRKTKTYEAQNKRCSLDFGEEEKTKTYEVRNKKLVFS